MSSAPEPSLDKPIWHMARGQQKFGPYPAGELRKWATTGQLQPTDLLWREGLANWTAAGQLPEFFPKPAAAAAPANVIFPSAPATPAPQPAVQPAPMNVTFPTAPTPAPAPAAQPIPATQMMPTNVAFPAAKPSAAPAPAPGQALQAKAAEIGSAVGFHLNRAMSWNLRNVHVRPEERAWLAGVGIDEPYAQNYLAWRRSALRVVILPSLVSAGLKAYGMFEGIDNLGELGKLVVVLQCLALFAVPATAALAANAWLRPRQSRNILFWGWLGSFLTPVATSLVPTAWLVPAGTGHEMVAMASLVVGIYYYITLLPAVLSLLPGVLRGCLRVKALLPESVLAGWFLVAASPVYALLFLVVSVLILQIAGNLFLIAGVLLMSGAPAVYVLHARLFTRPLAGDADTAQIGRVQNTYNMVSYASLGCLLIFLFTAEFFGYRLIGVGDHAMVHPGKAVGILLQFVLEFLGRSMLMTALMVEAVTLMTLSSWRHGKAFAAAPGAADYDRLMSKLDSEGLAAPHPAGPSAKD